MGLEGPERMLWSGMVWGWVGWGRKAEIRASGLVFGSRWSRVRSSDLYSESGLCGSRAVSGLEGGRALAVPPRLKGQEFGLSLLGGGLEGGKSRGQSWGLWGLWQ